MKEILSSIIFLAIAAGAIWGWSHWRGTVEENNDTRPSIGALATDTSVVSSTSDTSDREESKSEPETKEPEALKVSEPAKILKTDPAREALDVKVLNGGAVKGSAVRVQEFLKKQGYAKAQTGNAVGNYVDVTIFYLGSNESNAQMIKDLLLPDYPKIDVKLAISSKDESGGASVVVVMGK